MSRSVTTTGTAIAAVAALALAGCSSAGGDAAAGTDVATAPRDAVRDGGTMRWAVDSVPATLNAFQAGADGTTSLVAGAVLPTLFRLDGRGRPQRDADYLDSADVATTEPRQVVSYRLNPKARWTDGRAIGAADFAAQWKALRGKDDAYWTARNAGYDRIESVEPGKEPHEVRVTFAKPYADWQSLFAPLYPASVTGSATAFNDAARHGLPASAGPFSVRNVSPKGGTVTLARNPAWWGDRAKLDTLVLAAVPAARRPAALAAGTLDVAEIEPSAYAALRKQADAEKPKLAIRKTAEAAWSQLALNGAAGPLADERVRHAVARAIDRRAIADSVLKPLGLPSKPLGNHLLLATQEGYADHSSALGTADAASAQALLADAGWRPAKVQPAAEGAAPAMRSIRTGKALTLRFVLPESSITLNRVGVRIARMLAAIGVRTDITRVADDSFFRDHIASGDFDLALYSWPGTAYPATDDRPIFAKPEPAADGTLTVEQNYTRVGTDQIDQLLDQAAGELDHGAARDLTARADARIWAAAGSIPLYQRPQLVALRTGVANAGAFGFATPRYQDLGFTKK
ncbi:ABC transporter family substrate-binding protein [Streptomyces sp. NPDC059373]